MKAPALTKQISTLLAGAIGLGAMSVAAQVDGPPQIQFSQKLYDFGKTSLVTTVSGVFKFKNVGDTLLKLELPKTSRGCTVAKLTGDTFLPGEAGELPFTMQLGRYRALVEEHIAIRSNDPQNPVILLTISADYTPLYDINPRTLVSNLPFGENHLVQFATLSRTDGKPVQLARLETSKPWITASVEPSARPDPAVARICVAMRRNGAPRRFNESVQVYTSEQTNAPTSSIEVYGQIMGEVSLDPEALYWSITDAAKTVAQLPEALLPRRLTIRSANGQTFELKNPRSTIQGMKIELVPKEAGKAFELVARLDAAPTNTVTGNVSFETSMKTQSRIEVPVTVYVFKP